MATTKQEKAYEELCQFVNEEIMSYYDCELEDFFFLEGINESTDFRSIMSEAYEFIRMTAESVSIADFLDKFPGSDVMYYVKRLRTYSEDEVYDEMLKDKLFEDFTCYKWRYEKIDWMIEQCLPDAETEED